MKFYLAFFFTISPQTVISREDVPKFHDQYVRRFCKRFIDFHFPLKDEEFLSSILTYLGSNSDYSILTPNHELRLFFSLITPLWKNIDVSISFIDCFDASSLIKFLYPKILTSILKSIFNNNQRFQFSEIAFLFNQQNYLINSIYNQCKLVLSDQIPDELY
jgi:hypothetical protein